MPLRDRAEGFVPPVSTSNLHVASARLSESSTGQAVIASLLVSPALECRAVAAVFLTTLSSLMSGTIDRAQFGQPQWYGTRYSYTAE